MMSRKSSKVAPLSLLAVALLLAPADADAGQYANLCTSATAACVYTGPNAPTLQAEVCWNKVSVQLKGDGPCPAGAYAFWADYGEVVDPMLGLVVAYAPLPDACDLGLCTTAPPVDGTTAEPLCCNPELDDCTLHIQGQCDDVIVFCEQAATNESGSISCFDEG